MNIKGFKAKDGTVHKYDYNELANRPKTPEGEQGADGGYYTPAVTQPDADTLQFDFTPSKADMPSVEPVQVKLPAGQGSGGNVNDKLVLKSPDGTAWNITVSNAGVITATKVTSGGDAGGSEGAPTTLETYTIFVPENVSDEWKVTSEGALDMTTAEFLELFYDGFVSAPPSGMTVTKTSIGKDESGQYDMWEYDFCPANYSRIILLSSGMHTYELSASFGLANFIGHLYTDTGNDAFSYIRNNVRIKVIPVVNPWGFNQYPKKYGNINGVNPNRNFDLNGEWAAYNGDTNEWNQKGVAPFSESEVVNLARWAETNWNAEFWIDCHTGEGHADKDLWVYYSSDSVILDRINGGISEIETWFKETYGSDCVTTRTIDNPDSIRLHWAEKIAGIPGMTLEQAPQRTTFGTSASNEAADISNYSTNISSFVQEFLMEKYRTTESVEIQSVSLTDVVIPYGSPSVTATATVIPATTTQNKFAWKSDDESVCAVYGCSGKAVIVPKQAGTARITVTNHEKPAVSATFNVTVEEAQTYTITNKLTKVSTSNNATSVSSGETYTATLTPDEGYSIQSVVVTMGGVDISNAVYSDGSINIDTVSGDVAITATATVYIDDIGNEFAAEIAGIDLGSGLVIENNTRIVTDYIPVESNSSIIITCSSGIYIKAFEYAESKTLISPFIGDLISNKISGTIAADCGYVRLLMKKSDGSNITDDDFASVWIEFNETPYKLKKNNVGQTTKNLSCAVASINGAGAETESTTRVRTDYIPTETDWFYHRVSVDNVPFDKFLLRRYDENKQYVDSHTSNGDWFDLNNANISSGFDDSVAYIRILFRNSDDSAIEASDITGSITVNEFVYNLTAS